MSVTAELYRELKAEAREIYEAYRPLVPGRPPWEHLDTKTPQEMGMKAMAVVKAQEARNLESSLGGQAKATDLAMKAAGG